MCKKKSGITLIALVVTIIVLLILAGVTINMVLGENGLFNRAKISTQMHEKSALEEELQNIKAEAMMDAIKDKKELTVEDYVKLLEDKGMVADRTVIENENDDCDIITNSGYRVSVSKNENGELIIVVGEKDVSNKNLEDKKAPTVTEVKINTNNSIATGKTVSITIKAEDNQSGIDYTKEKSNESKYLFHTDKIIENESEETYTGTLSGAITGENMTPTINKAGTYYLHVMIKDIEGNISYGVSNETINVENSIEELAEFARQHKNDLEQLVPTLTSNTTTSMPNVACGVASESSYWYSKARRAYAAFNRNVTTNNINNCWQASSGQSSTGAYIRYQSTTPDTIIYAKVGTWDDNTCNSDKKWTTYIRGSNDGSTWKKISNNVVLTVKNGSIKYFEYEINDYNQYRYYEVYFDAQSGDAQYVAISNEYSCSFMFLQFYGMKNKTLLEFYNQYNNAS